MGLEKPILGACVYLFIVRLSSAQAWRWRRCQALIVSAIARVAAARPMTIAKQNTPSVWENARHRAPMATVQPSPGVQLPIAEGIRAQGGRMVGTAKQKPKRWRWTTVLSAVPAAKSGRCLQASAELWRWMARSQPGVLRSPNRMRIGALWRNALKP